jgi:hypothetical protein
VLPRTVRRHERDHVVHVQHLHREPVAQPDFLTGLL